MELFTLGALSELEDFLEQTQQNGFFCQSWKLLLFNLLVSRPLV